MLEGPSRAGLAWAGVTALTRTATVQGKGAWDLQGQPAHGDVAAPQHSGGNFRGLRLALHCVTLF